VRDVLALCEVESPSESLTAQCAVVELAEQLGSRLLGRRPDPIVANSRPALLWAPEPGGVLLLGHLDTVWPTGTLARWPLRTWHALSAPGVFDTKGRRGPESLRFERRRSDEGHQDDCRCQPHRLEHSNGFPHHGPGHAEALLEFLKSQHPVPGGHSPATMASPSEASSWPCKP
jgi:hypothetical protein